MEETELRDFGLPSITQGAKTGILINFSGSGCGRNVGFPTPKADTHLFDSTKMV